MSVRLKSTSPVRWLVFAAALHVLATITVFLVGHFRLLPKVFDENGIGVSFAIDGVQYQSLIAEMANVLRQEGFGAWLNIQAPFHCRLYSFSFIFPGRLVGYNILAAEPLNLSYYLGVLVLVFLLGREICNKQTGFAAALIVAIWPSFLLHSTQLIRDSFAILCVLAFLFILTTLLDSELSWRRCLTRALVSIPLLVTLWLTRANMWIVVFIALLLTSVLLLVRMFRERKLLLSHIALLCVILFAAVFIPTKIESTTVPGYRPPTSLVGDPFNRSTSRSFWSRLVTQVGVRRTAFKAYSGKGSNIDTDVEFKRLTDVAGYLPRAAEIGFFAPFPKMWLDTGLSGRAARILAAVETSAMYLLYIAMVVCVWQHRRRLEVWLIFLFATVTITALGLVVANVGALYRLRFGFWMLLLLLGVEGVRLLRARQETLR